MNSPEENIVYDGGFVNIFRTIGCIGDSLSSGEQEYVRSDGKPGYYDMYEYSWGQFIARRCGNKVYNFSKGGLRSKTFIEYASMNQIFLPEKRCQAYIVALGVNDIYNIDETYSEGFGTIADVDFNSYANNKDSLVGQYTKILQMIVEAQPKAKIFLVTMPANTVSNPKIEELKNRHAEFLRSLPKYFKNAYIIDFNKYWHDCDQNFKDRYVCGHLTAMGYKVVADKIMNYMDFIINTNYNDFKHTAFIDKPIDGKPRD